MLKPMRALVLAGGLIELKAGGTAKLAGWEKSNKVYLWGLPGGGAGPMYGAPGPEALDDAFKTRSDPKVKSGLNQWRRVTVLPLRGTSRSIIQAMYLPAGDAPAGAVRVG
jgi:hypothetical protein